MVIEPFIGNHLEVSESNNSSYLSLKGLIVDETKNTLVIQTITKEQKTLLKKGSVFVINGKIINGDDICKRLEDRIKQRRSKQWKQ